MGGTSQPHRNKSEKRDDDATDPGPTRIDDLRRELEEAEIELKKLQDANQAALERSRELLGGFRKYILPRS